MAVVFFNVLRLIRFGDESEDTEKMRVERTS